MPSDPRLLLCRQYPCQQLAYEIESAAVGLPFGVRAPIAGTLPVREASAPSGADAAPSAGKRLVAGADCDGGVPRGTPSAGAAEVAFRGGIAGRTVPSRLAGRFCRPLPRGRFSSFAALAGAEGVRAARARVASAQPSFMSDIRFMGV